jgi:putative copper export protein
VIAELLIGGLRVAHALAAAIWLGGTLVYMLVEAPVRAAVGPGVWRGFREALKAGIGIFVVTGALLTMERLSSAALPPTYFAVLAVKVALGISMFLVARRIGAPTADGLPPGFWSRAEVRVLALGVVVYALAAALKAIYEETIRFHG